MRRDLAAWALMVWLAVFGACARADDDTDPAELRRQLLVMIEIKPGPRQDLDRKRLAQRLAREHGLALEYRWPMPLLRLECFVMQVPAKRSLAQVAERLSRHRRVAWVEPMQLFRTRSAPPSHDDPLFAVQPNAAAWHLAELHQWASGRGVRVAIIDSAIDVHHPDLAGQVAWRENFVDGHAAASEAHGTAVAGLIAARADNGVGIAGVAPQARLLALRACWQQAAESTLCSSVTLARALQSAIEHDAQVVNLSLSGPPDRLVGALLDAALARGITVISAFDEARPDGGFPAAHAGVLAVGARGGHAAGLNAPGRDLPTSLPGARWGFVSGVSYEVAQVSGLVALLLELGVSTPALSLMRGPGGAVDACASVQGAATGCACACGAMAHR